MTRKEAQTLSLNRNWVTYHAISQRRVHGIGMMKKQEMTNTKVRHNRVQVVLGNRALAVAAEGKIPNTISHSGNRQKISGHIFESSSIAKLLEVVASRSCDAAFDREAFCRRRRGVA